MLKFISTLLVTILFIFQLYGQNSQNNSNRFYEIITSLNEKRYEQARLDLESWEAENPQYAEIYSLWLNYYFLVSIESMVTISKEKPLKGEYIPFTDTTGNIAGYLGEAIYTKDELLEKGFKKIDEGIALYPDRLDFYFGKAHVMYYSGNYEGCIAILLKAIDRSTVNGAVWKWNFSEERTDSYELFTEGLQEYFAYLMDAGEIDLASLLVEKAHNRFPENAIYISDLGSTAYYKGEYEKAEEYYRKALTVSPDDYLIMTNLAILCKMQGKREDAIKYLNILKECGIQEYEENAQSALQQLN